MNRFAKYFLVNGLFLMLTYYYGSEYFTGLLDTLVAIVLYGASIIFALSGILMASLMSKKFLTKVMLGVDEEDEEKKQSWMVIFVSMISAAKKIYNKDLIQYNKFVKVFDPIFDVGVTVMTVSFGLYWLAALYATHSVLCFIIRGQAERLSGAFSDVQLAEIESISKRLQERKQGSAA